MNNIIYTTFLSLLLFYNICYSKNKIKETIDKLDFNLTEETYIDPKFKEYKINTYMVLPAEIHGEWLNKKEKEDERKGYEVRNAEKIELMLLSLEKNCIDRSKLDKNLKGKELSYHTFTKDSSIKDIFTDLNIDAVIIITISSMGYFSSSKMSSTEIHAKAIYIETGKIVWKSLLEGYVHHDSKKISTNIVTNKIETKLYKLLKEKLKNKI